LDRIGGYIYDAAVSEV